MCVKVTKSGLRKYVQLVEAYRDENGRPKQRTIAILGRLDKLGDELETVVEGLCRITGRSLPDKPTVSFESSRVLGDVWALLSSGMRSALNSFARPSAARVTASRSKP